MAERIELNGQDLEAIAGGAFNFRYNSKGRYICDVDGIGVFYADETAKRKINIHDIQNPGMSEQDLVNWAKSEGLLWR